MTIAACEKRTRGIIVMNTMKSLRRRLESTTLDTLEDMSEKDRMRTGM